MLAQVVELVTVNVMTTLPLVCNHLLRARERLEIEFGVVYETLFPWSEDGVRLPPFEQLLVLLAYGLYERAMPTKIFFDATPA